MLVKPQEEWNKNIITDVASVPEEAKPSIEQRVNSLEVNEKTELAHRDTNRERLRMLENKEYSHTMFEVMMKNMNSLEAEIQRCNLGIASFEETNKVLRQAVNHDTTSILKEPNRGTK